MSHANDAPVVLTPAAPIHPQTVVFVDSTLPQWQDLLKDISPDAQVVILDPLKDGVVQMAAALQGSTGVAAVHLLTHGGPGFLVIGNTMLSSYNMDSYAPELATIRAALSGDADVLLYGCDVAEGTAGAVFVQQFALATGADVAASSDDTGVSGDWVLEVQTGTVEAQGIEAVDYTADLATIVVTNLNDSGAGSLRAAIASANNTSADTIVFDPALFASAAGTITLTSGAIDVHGNANAADALTIVGPGENLLTISGNNASRVFAANSNFAGTNNQSPLSLSGMTLTAGKNTTYESGGALNFTQSGSLTLDHVRITNSSSIKASGGGGYFIGTSGDNLTISNATFSGNTSIAAIAAPTYGGGLVAMVGAYTTTGTLTITNSTFSGNQSAGGGGGALLNTGGGGAASILVTNSTFANNTSNTSYTTSIGGGGLLTMAGNITVINSTITGNTANTNGLLEGGGFAANNTTLVIKNTLIANNASISGVSANQNLWLGQNTKASGSNNLVLNGIGVYTTATNTITAPITTLVSRHSLNVG